MTMGKRKPEADKIRTCKGCLGKFTYRMENSRPKYGKEYCTVDCSRKHTKGSGRPTLIDADRIKKLEEAFALDCSIGEACFYADISKQTYYNRIEKDPKLLDRFEALREKPVLIARQTVVKSLKDNAEMALKYLERKRKKEFSTRTETDITGEINHNVVKVGRKKSQ